MRVVFFGTSTFAVPSLEAVAASGHQVMLCVTQPDRARGRGLSVEPTPVKVVAQRLGLPIAQPERLDAGTLASTPSDVGVLASYGKMVPQSVLVAPRHGLLGVHPSLLPKYRGASPVAWAILGGERTTGMTIYRLNDALDAGEILLQEPVEICAGETAQALTARLAQIGAQCVVRALAELAQGRARWIAQDGAQATVAPKLTKVQGRVDWQQPAQALERLVRALTPWPGVVCAWKGEPLKLCHVRVGAGSGEAAAGTVVGVAERTVLVQTGQGVLELVEVQPAGRRRMTIAEFLAGHPMHVGERLERIQGQEQG
jgi:methionyl-tRNA formyltransferase